MKRFILMIFACVMLLASCTTAGPEEEVNTSEQITAPTKKEAVDPTPDNTDYPALMEERFGSVSANAESDFTYTIENQTATVTAFGGAGGSVRVPETLGGVTVTGIGDGAFAGRDDLETLILPDTVVHFGTGILSDTELKAFRTPFPLSAGYFGYLWGAEQYSSNNQQALRTLEYVEIRTDSETDLDLPEHAFYDCNDLIAVLLPENCKIGDYAFFQCESLRFVNAGVIAEVGAHAFEACGELQKLTFGSCLTRIGFAALRNCNQLTDLTLPFVGETREENTYLGYVFGAGTIGFSSGFYSPVLRRLVLLEECTKLPDYALYECTSLQSVTFPQTLTAVGARSMSNCTSLTSLTFPDSCLSIGDAACAGCTSLKTVTYSDSAVLGVEVFLGCPIG